MDPRTIATESKPRTLDEIVLAIVRLLGDVEGKDLVYPEAVTRSWVLSSIGDWSEFASLVGYWHSPAGLALIANHARELAGLIAKIEAKLESLPGPLAEYLFMPPLARGPTAEEVTLDFLVGQGLADKAMLLDRLGRMRRDCERQRPPPHSHDHGRDSVKDRAARLAHGLMRRLSKQQIVGAPSTGGSTFYLIASLLYEAFSGEQDQDLKRACDRVLKPAQKRKKRERDAEKLARMSRAPKPRPGGRRPSRSS